jgi:hypothetical protein
LQYIVTTSIFSQIYSNLPFYKMKWNNFYYIILFRLYFNIIYKGHANTFCIGVASAMPMLLYRFLNLLKWIWFRYLNLNIYMIHINILSIFENRKSHGLLNSKFMDYTFDCHFYVDYNAVHWLMGCVLGTWN